jgi:hypothetical protein
MEMDMTIWLHHKVTAVKLLAENLLLCHLFNLYDTMDSKILVASFIILVWCFSQNLYLENHATLQKVASLQCK